MRILKCNETYTSSHCMDEKAVASREMSTLLAKCEVDCRPKDRKRSRFLECNRTWHGRLKTIKDTNSCREAAQRHAEHVIVVPDMGYSAIDCIHNRGALEP